MATFGWSASDLIVAIQTVGIIVDALDTAAGASARYQTTSAFLKSLLNTLTHLRGATTVGLDPIYAAAVQEQVDIIKKPLEAFISDISKYDKSLGTSASKQALKTIPRKLQWAFTVEEKVAKLERIIASPLACVSILLTQQALSALSSLQKDLPISICDAISDMLERSPTEQIREALKVHERSNSKMLELAVHATTSVEIQDAKKHFDLTNHRLEVTLEKHDLYLREIRASLDRMTVQPEEKHASSAVTENFLHEPYLKAYLYMIAASLKALWYSLIAIAGPELLLLLHALRMLDSVANISMGDSFYFIDVFGRRDRLPWMWFRNWKVFHSFVKAVQDESIGHIAEELSILAVYGLTQRHRTSSFMVRHDLWQYIMRPQLELSAGIIVVTLCESDPDCPRCFALRTPDQKCSICGMLFYRPFVNAKPMTETLISDPYKIKISATISSDITGWTSRGMGYLQPLTSVHWLDSVKRVVSIYTRRPTTKLILFTFDCVLEQLWQVWSSSSKLQKIILGPSIHQTGSGSSISVTSELTSFRSSYCPLAVRYGLKISPLTIKQKATFQTELLASTRDLKSLLRDLRDWLTLSRLSKRAVSSAALPALFYSLFHERFLQLIHRLRFIAQTLDICGESHGSSLQSDSSIDINITSAFPDSDSSLELTPASSAPASPIITPPPNPSSQIKNRASLPDTQLLVSLSDLERQQPPLSDTAMERARRCQEYMSRPDFATTPRFWWGGLACDACAFEVTNDTGHWHCNRCNYGDYDLCELCVVEAGGCKGQLLAAIGKQLKESERHVLEWVQHPLLERAWRKWEVDENIEKG